VFVNHSPRDDYLPDSGARDNLNHRHDLRRIWFLWVLLQIILRARLHITPVTMAC
jgi:hypothetical protein